MSNLLEEHVKGSVFIKRLLIVIAIQLVLVVILVSRLVYLQIINYDDFKNRSENNRIKVSTIPPIRGNIIDRNNNKLTNNRNGYELILYKNTKQSESEFIQSISSILDLNEEKIYKIKKQLKNNRNKPIVSVLSNLTWEELIKFENNVYKINNVSVEEGYVREYLYSKEFAHILGYVSIPNDKDISKLSNKISKNVLLHPNFKIGKNGLEASFNSRLTGKSGYKKTEVKACNVPWRDLEKGEAEAEKDIK